MKYIKKYWLDIILLIVGFVLCILSVWHWFDNNSIIYFVDSLLTIDVKNSFIRMFYNIDSHTYPWNSEPSWSWAIYWIIITLFRKLFGSLSLAQFSVYVSLLFFSVFNFYILAKYLGTTLLKNTLNSTEKIIYFLFAIFYTFNLYTFYYAYFTFNPDAFILSFLPLNIVSLFKAYPLDKVKPSGGIMWLLIFFATLIMMSPGFLTYIQAVQYLAWIGGYSFLYIIFSWQRISIKRFLSLCIFLVMTGLSVWWWFLPAFLDFKDIYKLQSSTGTTSWFNTGFSPSQLLNSFRVLGIPLMAGNPFPWSAFYTTNKLFTFPLFLLPFLILFFIFKLPKLKHSKTFLYLLLMLFVSLFIVKFSTPPFVFITKFAFEHVPFFGAFRDAFHKAGIYYLLPFFAIAAISAGLILQHLQKRKNKILIVFSGFMIFLLGVVITGPFFLFSYDNLIKYKFISNHQEHFVTSKTQIPKEYYDLKNIFEPECRGKAIMIVPRGGWISSGEWKETGRNYIGVDLLQQLIDCSFMTNLAYKSEAEVSNQAFYNLLLNDDMEEYKRLLLKNQVGFVLLRFDNVPYGPTTWQYVDPKLLDRKLASDKDFEKETINKYFTVYKFKPLSNINSYGFALSKFASYTNSPFVNSVDYILMSKKTANVIGPAAINQVGLSTKYKDVIDRYIAEGICSNCSSLGEIERLDIGTKNREFNFKLNIVKNGQYFCETKVYVPGTQVTSISISGKDNYYANSNSLSVQLSEGNYSINTSYTPHIFMNEQQINLESGNTKEFHLGKLAGRSFGLSYNVDSQEQGVEVILSKKRLSSYALNQKQLNQQDIEFVIPTGSSVSAQKINRIFQVDEFNPSDYFVYLRIAPGFKKAESAIVRNLVIESAIDTNYINFSCVLETNLVNEDYTRLFKVTQISPIKYSITLSKGFKKGFITFNKTYIYDWKAFAEKNGRTQVFPHMQNGYSNAWYIDSPINRRITVVFARHEIIEKNGLTSFAAFVILFIILAIIRKKND